MASVAISEHLIKKKIGGSMPQTPLACVYLRTHHHRCPPNLKYLPPPLRCITTTCMCSVSFCQENWQDRSTTWMCIDKVTRGM